MKIVMCKSSIKDRLIMRFIKELKKLELEAKRRQEIFLS